MSRFLIIVFFTSIANNAFTCSAFKHVNEQGVIVAKNFDWRFGQGYLVQNNRNQSKCTYLAYDGRNTCWTSKYGSVTFNQNGKEFPYGGMNEKGLVVEMLWLKETQYEEAIEDASVISELEWIQYQLDNFSSVKEVIQNSNTLEIDPITATIHYFITDSSGNSAIVEFIDGKCLIIEDDNSIQTITNSSFELGEAFYLKNESKFSDVYIPKNSDSRLRYCSVRNNLVKLEKKESFDTKKAFEILEHVSENKEFYKTYWTIVYDLKSLQIEFKTFANKEIRQLNLKDLDFTRNESLGYDLLSSTSKTDINDELRTYSKEENTLIIETSIEPYLAFEYEQLNAHQIDPQSSRYDNEFSSKHSDVIVTIKTPTPKGFVKFFLADSEMNYRRQGPYGANATIHSETTKYKLYSLRTDKQYAFGAMHDLNGNGILDRNFLKMPSEPFAFSGRKRFFFLPPKFKKATFEFSEEITISIK